MRTNKRQDDLDDFFQQVKAEFSQKYPELERLSDEEALEFRKKWIAEQEEENQERLKEHTEVFSDAIIAVIATVMLLEIPVPINHNFHDFIAHILIFLTTFFLVADKWWDNHKLYNQIKTITPKVVIAQFAFMASLALLPILARWMMEEITTTAVISYGVAVLITNFFHWLLHMFISQLRFADMVHTKTMVRRMNYRRLALSLFIGCLTIALAFINPGLAFNFYMLSPLISFWHSLHPKRGRA